MEFIGNTFELAHHSTGFVRNLNAGNSETLVLSGGASGNQQANKITSSETINTVTNLDYKAAESITLRAGFTAKAGSDIHLQIAPLNQTPEYKWQYRIADHLGNTRVLFADKDNDGLIRQSADSTNEVLGFYNYSAFGLELGGSHLNASNNLNRYTYNGKEDIGFSGYLDYGNRCLDPTIGRFTAVDRFSAKYAGMSNYGYGGNSPINFVDVNGDSLRVSFSGQEARDAFQFIMNMGLEGQFTSNINDDGFVTFGATEDGGDISKMTDSGRAFYNEISNVISDEKTTQVNVTYGSSRIATGLFGEEMTRKPGKMDVADMLQFNTSGLYDNNPGDGGPTSIGKMTHEIVEQYYKQTKALNFTLWSDAHSNALDAEDKVNGSIRSDGVQETYKSEQIFTNDRYRTTATIFTRGNIIKVRQNRKKRQ